MVWKIHIPEFRPTEKQLASLLNDTESTTVEGAVSIGGRVFIVEEGAYKSQCRVGDGLAWMTGEGLGNKG